MIFIVGAFRTGGTYLFDSFSVTGNTQLDITSPTTVYVTGDVTFSNNVKVNSETNNPIPANFLIYVVGDQSVTLQNSAKIHGAIYAPQSSNFTIQNRYCLRYEATYQNLRVF